MLRNGAAHSLLADEAGVAAEEAQLDSAANDRLLGNLVDGLVQPHLAHRCVAICRKPVEQLLAADEAEYVLSGVPVHAVQAWRWTAVVAGRSAPLAVHRRLVGSATILCLDSPHHHADLPSVMLRLSQAISLLSAETTCRYTIVRSS